MNNWKTAILAAALAAGAAHSQTPVKTQESLYQRLGGMPAVRAVMDDLMDRILADERINKWFAHAAADPAVAAAYKARLGDLVCQATGGPCKYTGDLFAAHHGRGITLEAFNAMVDDIAASLDKLHVASREKAELLALLAPLKSAIVQ